MQFPKFCHNENYELDSIQRASFCTLQKLYAMESQSVLKYCYKLNSKVLSPPYLEKQNVNLEMQLFNVYTLQGLLTFVNQTFS